MNRIDRIKTENLLLVLNQKAYILFILSILSILLNEWLPPCPCICIE